MPGKPKRPYLLRALYDWIVDSDWTPYLVVATDSAAVHVPEEYVTDGRIVLNVSPLAVRDLNLGTEQVTFSGRFGGRPFPVSVPLPSVLAIYAKETGEGMVFEAEYPPGGDEPEPPEPGPSGHLKVVK